MRRFAFFVLLTIATLPAMANGPTAPENPFMEPELICSRQGGIDPGDACSGPITHNDIVEYTYERTDGTMDTATAGVAKAWEACPSEYPNVTISTWTTSSGEATYQDGKAYCVKDPENNCESGTTRRLGVTYEDGNHPGVTNWCYDGCQYDGGGPSQFRDNGDGTVTYIASEASATGDSCSGDAPSATDPDNNDGPSEDECTYVDAQTGECMDKDAQGGTCPDNTTEGTYNDTQVCVPENDSGDGGDPGDGDNGDGDDNDSGNGDDGNGDGNGDAPDGDTTTGTITLPDGTTHEVEFDTEGLAQEKTTQEIRDELKDLTDDEGATDEPKDQFDKDVFGSSGDGGAWGDTGIDDAIDQAEQGEPDGIDAQDEAEGLQQAVEDAIPDVGCSGVSFDIYDGHTWTLDCGQTSRIRDILSWIFYALTALSIFQLFTESGGGKH